MNVLIVGGGGFIGIYFALLLVGRGHEVILITRWIDGCIEAIWVAGVCLFVVDLAVVGVDEVLGDDSYDVVVYLVQFERFREFFVGVDDMVVVNIVGAVRLV